MNGYRQSSGIDCRELKAYDLHMRRLTHTIRNMLFPDPSHKGAAQALEEYRLNKELPWKRSDWIALVILSLMIAAIIGLSP